MKAIIIGAGRGARLMPHTEESPKCFAEVRGKRILDWGLESLRAAGLTDVVFIGGYRIETVRSEYPDLTFCYNVDWQDTNILASLMRAEAHMSDGFVCAYSDILYRREILQRLVRGPYDVTLVCDTTWRTRYLKRTEHPESDAEKISAKNDRVLAIDWTMPSETARGEYIGITRFTSKGAKALKEVYYRAREKSAGGAFQAAETFWRAYLIDLYQKMIEMGSQLHLMETEGGYMEIDTNQDYQIARGEWTG